MSHVTRRVMLGSPLSGGFDKRIELPFYFDTGCRIVHARLSNLNLLAAGVYLFHLVMVDAVQKYGDNRDQSLVVLLLHAGLRVAEACSLTMDDVVIRQRSGMVRMREGKGRKHRENPLNVTVRKVLADYIDGLTGEWLFPGRKGRMTTRTAERILMKYARLAGVEATPQLRHTFCKGLVDAGVSLDKVSVLAGRSNLSTTARYVRPSMRDLERAVDRLTWE